MDMELRRRFFAEEVGAVTGSTTPALIEALAAVPREAFLGPGPWVVRGEGNFGKPERHTPDADPRHTCHNYSIAIDPARQLFNGAPGVVVPAIDALALTRGARVRHVGSGMGYYSAVLAHIVGDSGRVLAVEVDATLAAQAGANLSSTPWAEVRCGNGTEPLGETFDAMLVSAGVTHVQNGWLDALATGRAPSARERLRGLGFLLRPTPLLRVGDLLAGGGGHLAALALGGLRTLGVR